MGASYERGGCASRVEWGLRAREGAAPQELSGGFIRERGLRFTTSSGSRAQISAVSKKTETKWNSSTIWILPKFRYPTYLHALEKEVLARQLLCFSFRNIGMLKVG